MTGIGIAVQELMASCLIICVVPNNSFNSYDELTLSGIRNKLITELQPLIHVAWSLSPASAGASEELPAVLSSCDASEANSVPDAVASIT